MDKNFTVDIIDKGKYYLMKVGGVIDSYTYDQFQKQLYNLVNSKSVCIDMSAIQNISSSGLGTIMYAIEQSEEKGNKVYILNPSTIALEAIKSTGFSDMFNVINNEDSIK